ncbi:Sin3 family co-repressor-domain-containing protein [Lanmaoa asiatica]|nr:Sin3 family co-repressor-domain-containing protein [Lanmaoa asiatica]
MDKDKIGKKPVVSAQKRRRKGPEKDTTPVPSSRSITKKLKHTHKPGEPDSPHYTSYALPPPSPPHPTSLPQTHVMPPPPLPHMGMLPPVMNRAKRTLESRDTYDEFLKLLTLYSKDIIDAKTLVNLSQVFLGDGDLLAQFKDVLRIDEFQSSVEHGPPGSIRTGPPEPLPALPADQGEGPSYRKLPESEVNLACSSRDELCRSVLNDIWVSHPTWASEEAGFISHKKNSFEEALHKSEEERHEYQVQLDALARTIALFEPLSVRIEEMTNEERAMFRLKADFGGSSRSIYYRTLKKVYGRDASTEVIQALQDCPSVAVPVVLARLKAKDEEWRRIQREWNKTWREVDAKNFYKSLDHQGNQFKQNDKKQITAKHFVQHVEGIKEAQERKLARRGRPSFAAGSVGHQLEFEFPQTSVLHDSLRPGLLLFRSFSGAIQPPGAACDRGLSPPIRAVALHVSCT